MTTALAIKLPEIPHAVSIEAEWLHRRDAILAESKGFATIPNPETFQAATESLSAVTKHSNALEKKRTDLSGPFTEAAKLIKLAADKARDSLEIEKNRLKIMLGTYAEDQRRKAADEAAQIQREQNEAIERQIAAQAVAEDLGMEASPVIVPDAPAPTVIAPKAFGAAIVERIEFEIVDLDAVPRAFCMVDERLINAYKRENADAIKAHVRGGNATGLVPGVKFTIRTDVASR